MFRALIWVGRAAVSMLTDPTAVSPDISQVMTGTSPGLLAIWKAPVQSGLRPGLRMTGRTPLGSSLHSGSICSVGNGYARDCRKHAPFLLCVMKNCSQHSPVHSPRLQPGDFIGGDVLGDINISRHPVTARLPPTLHKLVLDLRRGLNVTTKTD